tara:strand:+ start:148 stop:324 length:177 start_codon:yes stop_codon:yes gene_type:complete
MKNWRLPTIMLIISSVIRLPNVIRKALVIQSAATKAISTLLIFQATSTREEEATSLVI